MGRLAGKVAFVTGAGGGIGRAICSRFLAEGANVVAADIALDAANSAMAAVGPDRARPVACDVGDDDQVRSAIGSAVESFGRVDVLCNVAGGSTGRDGRVTEAPLDEFWRAIRLDLFGTFLCCRHGIPAIVAAGGGSVINMASMVALMAVRDKDCYTAAKGGIVALTRSMAAEYAPDRVRVNAIAPSVTLTPRVAARMEGDVHALSPLHLLGLLEPDDVAGMAVYLASDESRRVTGQIIPVDSGVTLGARA